MKGLSFSEWSDLPLSYHVLQTTSRKPPHRTMILSAIIILLTSTTVFRYAYIFKLNDKLYVYMNFIQRIWGYSVYRFRHAFLNLIVSKVQTLTSALHFIKLKGQGHKSMITARVYNHWEHSGITFHEVD